MARSDDERADKPGIGNPPGRRQHPKTHPTPSDAPEEEPRLSDEPDLDQIPDEEDMQPDSKGPDTNEMEEADQEIQRLKMENPDEPRKEPDPSKDKQ